MPIIRNPFRRTDDAARVNATAEKAANATVAPPKHIDLKDAAEYKLSGESSRFESHAIDVL